MSAATLPADQANSYATTKTVAITVSATALLTQNLTSLRNLETGTYGPVEDVWNYKAIRGLLICSIVLNSLIILINSIQAFLGPSATTDGMSLGMYGPTLLGSCFPCLARDKVDQLRKMASDNLSVTKQALRSRINEPWWAKLPEATVTSLNVLLDSQNAVEPPRWQYIQNVFKSKSDAEVEKAYMASKSVFARKVAYLDIQAEMKKVVDVLVPVIEAVKADIKRDTVVRSERSQFLGLMQTAKARLDYILDLSKDPTATTSTTATASTTAPPSTTATASHEFSNDLVVLNVLALLLNTASLVMNIVISGLGPKDFMHLPPLP